MNIQISFVHRPPALLYAPYSGRPTENHRVLHSHNNVCELVFVNVGEGCYILNRGAAIPFIPGISCSAISRGSS